MRVLEEFLDYVWLVDLSNLLLSILEESELMVGVAAPSENHLFLLSLSHIDVLIALVKRLVITTNSCIASISLV